MSLGDSNMPAILLILALFWIGEAFAGEGSVTGGEFDYVVKKGDSLVGLGARFGVPSKLIASANGLKYNARLMPGMRLRLDNRHVVPQGMEDGILINLPQRMLFRFMQGRLDAAYPVGLGKPSWPTPSGEFTIVDHERDKVWVVPKSIQEEMKREGKPVLTRVPPGPENPLGRYWMGLSIGGYGIHGTLAPASVYHFQSHGCIRMQPEHIEALFDKVGKGTRGRLIYRPLLIAASENGRILMEADPDIYRKRFDYLKAAHEIAGPLESRIDWKIAGEVIARRDGIARDVTLEKGVD